MRGRPERLVTDAELIEKKLAFIETCVRELRALARVESIPTDLREERFAAYTLQVAVQAALDVVSKTCSGSSPRSATALRASRRCAARGGSS
jgi:uncharacterized protein YutE (UPF0331/DUF86 family)